MATEISTVDRPFGVPLDVVICLPIPISTNRARRIDWANHPDVLRWRKQADALVLQAKRRKVNPLKLERIPRFELHFLVSNTCKTDLDNLLKLAIDYLRKVEIIEDDSP